MIKDGKDVIDLGISKEDYKKLVKLTRNGFGSRLGSGPINADKVGRNTSTHYLTS